MLFKVYSYTKMIKLAQRNVLAILQHRKVERQFIFFWYCLSDYLESLIINFQVTTKISVGNYLIGQLTEQPYRPNFYLILELV